MVSVDFRFICDGERKKGSEPWTNTNYGSCTRLVTPLARPHLGAPKLILKRLVLLLVFIIESVHKGLCLGNARRRRHGAGGLVDGSSFEAVMLCRELTVVPLHTV